MMGIRLLSCVTIPLVILCAPDRLRHVHNKNTDMRSMF